MSPNFDPRVLEYQAQLASNVSSVTLTATTESTAATIEVDGQPLGRTGRVITLEPGASKTVIIDVTAEAGNVARTILWLNRESARDTNTRLSRLQLAGAQLDPELRSPRARVPGAGGVECQLRHADRDGREHRGHDRGRRTAAGQDRSGHHPRPARDEDGRHRRDGRGRQRRADHRLAEQGVCQGHEHETLAPAAGGSAAATRTSIPACSSTRRRWRRTSTPSPLTAIGREPRGHHRGRRAAAGQDRSGHHPRPGRDEDSRHRRDGRGRQRRADHRQVEPGVCPGHEHETVAPCSWRERSCVPNFDPRVLEYQAQTGVERQRRHPERVGREPRGHDRGRRAAAEQDRSSHRPRTGRVEDRSHRRDGRGRQRRAHHRQAEPGVCQGHERETVAPCSWRARS